MPTDHLLLSIRATSTPGASRSASGILVTPERRMSSLVMTNTAAGMFDAFSGCLERVVTWICESCSRDMFFSAVGSLALAICIWQCPTAERRTRVQFSHHQRFVMFSRERIGALVTANIYTALIDSVRASGLHKMSCVNLNVRPDPCQPVGGG